MKVRICRDAQELGREGARLSAEILKKAIGEKGKARIVLSTGASQFDTLQALVESDVDWTKVEMFHLDEYVGLSEEHPASFRKYLKERFTSKINLKRAHFVTIEGELDRNIAALSEELRKEPIDLALVGIGENGHIAFNDPPADFDSREAYIVVNLDDRCKMQQVGEGWFPTINDVPKQAVTMTVYQIMQSNVIVSCVPYSVKAKAVKATLENEVTNQVPATMLKEHSDVTLFIDKDSASLVDKSTLDKYIMD